ncbi:MAG: F0F1 ATP synthase subunit delta [Propionibacteriaceae bacterium]|jgi:F-type H+-transporting ATPase subunit delta|nr:F0F1 ATP synthase subunit delta [Propionibacteriaceae bacterium]
MAAPVTATRRSQLDAVLDGAAADAQTARDLLALARALDATAYLGRALTEPSTPPSARQQVARELFAGRVSPAALTVLTAAVAEPWPSPAALRRALERQGVRACWLWADRLGQLDQAVDELFAFGQLAGRDHELRRALTDFTVDPDRRRGLVRQLLADHAHPAAVALAEQAAVAPSGTFEDAIARDLDLAGELKGRLHAQATVAAPLSRRQRARLAAALAQRAGRPVVVEEVVDPSVVGGVRVTLGDDVIDGTLAARLAAARRQLDHLGAAAGADATAAGPSTHDSETGPAAGPERNL